VRPVIFLAADGLVALNAVCALSLLRLRGGLDAILGFAILALAQVFISLLIAGAFLGSLHSTTVVAVTAVCSVLLLGIRVILRGFSLGLPVVGSTRGALARVFSFVRMEARQSPWSFCLVALAVATYAWRAIVAFALPPYAFDALWYHLTTVAGWIQAGKITPSHLSGLSALYPANAELYFTWPSVFLHDDTLTKFVQFGFALIGGLAVAGIACMMGASKRGGAAACSLFLLMPLIISQANTNYNDVAAASAFLVALYFVLRFLSGQPFTQSREKHQKEERLYRPVARSADLLLGGIAAGITLGTKQVSILYVTVLGVLLLTHLVLAVARKRIPTSSAVRCLLMFIVPAFMFGSYWYLHNWLQYGDPIYPLGLRVLGVSIFRGMSFSDLLTPAPGGGPLWREMARSWYGELVGWPKGWTYSYDGRYGGFGPPEAFLGVPLALVLVIAMFRRNMAFLVNFILVVAVILLLQPYKWWTRFTIVPIGVVSILAIVYVVEKSPALVSRLLQVASLILVCIGVWYSNYHIETGLGPAVTASEVVRLASDPPTIGYLDPEFSWVDRLGPHQAIAVDTGSPGPANAPRFLFFYPLFGSGFEHRVIPLSGKTSTAVVHLLRKENTRYAFVSRGGFYDSLLKNDRGCFENIEQDQNSRLYVLRGSCLP
jgi:hypothetical protein